jgi:hypothetical protein
MYSLKLSNQMAEKFRHSMITRTELVGQLRQDSFQGKDASQIALVDI